MVQCLGGKVPWTARRSNQSILKEINPETSLEGLILALDKWAHHCGYLGHEDIFLYSFSVYSCHLFLISSGSVSSIHFLSFFVPIFAWNVPLVSLIFLKRSLVFPILLFIRSMNQGKLEVVKQEMARVNTDTLGISELKWTEIGEFNSDDHYIYYCGQESLRRSGVALIVNKRVQNVVLGCNLKNDRMIYLFPRQAI